MKPSLTLYFKLRNAVQKLYWEQNFSALTVAGAFLSFHSCSVLCYILQVLFLGEGNLASCNNQSSGMLRVILRINWGSSGKGVSAFKVMGKLCLLWIQCLPTWTPSLVRRNYLQPQAWPQPTSMNGQSLTLSSGPTSIKILLVSFLICYTKVCVTKLKAYIISVFLSTHRTFLVKSWEFCSCLSTRFQLAALSGITLLWVCVCAYSSVLSATAWGLLTRLPSAWLLIRVVSLRTGWRRNPFHSVMAVNPNGHGSEHSNNHKGLAGLGFVLTITISWSQGLADKLWHRLHCLQIES